MFAFITFAGTSNYQDALKKLTFAEETSSEESMQQKWNDIHDLKRRKARCQKTFESDDETDIGKKIKLEHKRKPNSADKMSEVGSPSKQNFADKVSNNGSLSKPTCFSMPLPELLLDDNSTKSDELSTPPLGVNLKNCNSFEILSKGNK